MMHKARTKTIKNKFVLMLLAVLTPVLIGIVVIYVQGHQTMTQNAREMMNVRQNNIKTVLEEELLALYDFQKDYTINNDVNYLIDIYDTLSEENRLFYIREIMNELHLIKRNNDWISDLRINIPSLSLCISYEKLEHQISSIDQSIFTQQKESFVLFSIISEQLYMSSRFPATGTDVKYNIVCEVEKEKLQSILESYSLPNELICILDHEQNTQIALADLSSLATNDPNLLPQISAESCDKPDVVLYDQNEYLSLKQSLLFNELTIISIVPQSDVVSYIDLYQTLFIVTVVIAVIMIAIYYFIFSKMINRPIQTLLSGFRSVNKTPGEVVALNYEKNDEFRLLFDGFTSMVNNLQNYIEENYHQKILVQQMHLRQLQAQIDPHFLHNCFLNIYSLAELEDYELVQKFVKNLSQYYQYVTKNHQDVVTLKEEYDFCLQYMVIQDIRVGDYVKVKADPLPEKSKNIKVPRFILQPLIENAYKYGGFSKSQCGIIHLSFTQHQNYLQIKIADNGKNFTMEKLSSVNEILQSGELPLSSTGIANVQKRIQLFYRNDSHIEVLRSQLGGMEVRLLIHEGDSIC